jgi:hypothetical protein
MLLQPGRQVMWVLYAVIELLFHHCVVKYLAS